MAKTYHYLARITSSQELDMADVQAVLDHDHNFESIEGVNVELANTDCFCEECGVEIPEDMHDEQNGRCGVCADETDKQPELVRYGPFAD
jgi:hypothetical protein